MQGKSCLLSLLPCKKGEQLSPLDEFGLLKHLEGEYEVLVLTGVKTYERFVDDAINGLSFVSVKAEDVSASKCNNIVMAYGRVASLLASRRGLVKELYERLGVNPKSVERILSYLDSGKKLPPPKPSLQLSHEQVNNLAQLVRRLGFFNENIDGGIMISLLTGQLLSSLHVKWGKMVELSMFLSRLSYHHVIPYHWQSLITISGMLKSPNGKPLVATKFSNAVQRGNRTRLSLPVNSNCLIIKSQGCDIQSEYVYCCRFQILSFDLESTSQ